MIVKQRLSVLVLPNKKILKSITDVERHFDLMQAKHGVVTPAMVKESYLTPVSGAQTKMAHTGAGRRPDRYSLQH